MADAESSHLTAHRRRRQKGPPTLPEVQLPRLELAASDTEHGHSDDSAGEKEAKRQRSEPTTPVSTSSRHPWEYDAIMGITRESTIPMMNPSPTEIVELFSFVEATLIQYATDAVFQAVVHTLAPLVVYRPRLPIAFYPCPFPLLWFLRSCLLPLFLRGGGGSLFLSPSLSSPSLSVLFRGLVDGYAKIPG